MHNTLRAHHGSRPTLARLAVGLGCVALLATGLVVSTSGDAEARRKGGIVGQQAPRLDVDTWFNLPRGQSSIDMDDMKGKVVYMLFFQSWCPGCHSKGFPTLREVSEHFADADDVEFLTIQTVFEGFDTNDAAAARRTADEFGLDIPVGHDAGTQNSGSRVMQRYRSRGTPWVVIIDKRGVVRFNAFHAQPHEAKLFVESLRREK